MAEAHSAVAFSFAITHDGWDVNFDREVLYLVWESGIRSWKKRLARFRDDIADTPLSVLFLQLDTVAKAYLDNRRKLRRAKRQRTCEDEPAPAASEDYDLKTLLENKANNLEIPPSMSGEELIKLIKQNLTNYANKDRPLCDDEIDGSTTALCLTKAVIDAYSEANVIDLVKQNLFARLSNHVN